MNPSEADRRWEAWVRASIGEAIRRGEMRLQRQTWLPSDQIMFEMEYEAWERAGRPGLAG